MPDNQPNQIARVLAVIALVGAFLLVVITIATSGGGSDNGGDDDSEDTAESSGPTKKGERALENGVWVVGEGDTLVSISEETGIDIEELIDLNPNIDPQILNTGQRISLRPGLEGQDQGDDFESIDEQTTTTGSGTGVGDGGPSPGSGVSDGIDSTP